MENHEHLADHPLMVPTTHQQLVQACIQGNQTLVLTLLLSTQPARAATTNGNDANSNATNNNTNSSNDEAEINPDSGTGTDTDNNNEDPPELDLDAPDAEGTPCLVYAACWGHTHIAALLLAAGAQVDVADSNGWTPLMWAAANNHTATQLLLLDHGANPDRKTKQNRSLQEIVRSSSALSNHDFGFPPLDGSRSDSLSPIHEQEERNESRDHYQHALSDKQTVASSDDEADVDNDDWNWDNSSTAYSNSSATTRANGSNILKSTPRPSLFSLELPKIFLGSSQPPAPPLPPIPRDLDRDYDEEDNHISRTPFFWDTCKLDQILIFEDANIPRILHVAITELRPTKLSLGKPIPANIIFMAARYAHYLSSLELLNLFLGESVKAIIREIRTQGNNIHTLSYWISNCTNLLYYFQKDPSLCLATFKYQRVFAELIHELYDLIVAHVRGQILPILDAAILNYTDPDSIAPATPIPPPPIITDDGELSPSISTGENIGNARSFSATSRIKRASWILYKQTNELFSAAVRNAAATVTSLTVNQSQQYQQYLVQVRQVIPSPSLNPTLAANRHTHIFQTSNSISITPPPGSQISTPPTTPAASSFSGRRPSSSVPLSTTTSPLTTPPFPPMSNPKKSRRAPTPRAVTQILSATLQSLKLANVHFDIKRQIMHQILSSLNNALFEGLLTPPKGSAVAKKSTKAPRLSTANAAIPIPVAIPSTPPTSSAIHSDALITSISSSSNTANITGTRARAVNVRINLAGLDKWLRDNRRVFSTVTNLVNDDNNTGENENENGHDKNEVANESDSASAGATQDELAATFQLTRLMHVITSLDSLEAYVETRKSLPVLRSRDIRRVLDVYVLSAADGERNVHEDIELYVRQMEEVEALQQQHEDESEEGVMNSGRNEEELGAGGVGGPLFGFKVPMFEEGGILEWDESSRPYVPALVLRMLDGEGEEGEEDDDEEDAAGVVEGSSKKTKDDHTILMMDV
ncbi:hypothetical protein HK100_007537 [Physocladia obscura]|uniref:Dilute domain-containing protein n=1 Tax=Physocladia obscura TaxID=109957 RepID=A0AAD5XEV7_9FUNG|nr:hypothetical protein HK100_007537 [Physocladia obscura]